MRSNTLTRVSNNPGAVQYLPKSQLNLTLPGSDISGAHRNPFDLPHNVDRSESEPSPD